MKNSNSHLITRFWQSRPALPVLIICIFEFIGLLATPFAVFGEKAAAIGPWYQVYVGLTLLMTSAILYFLWRMEKIGIIVYACAYLIHNLVALIAGNWMIGLVIIPVMGMFLISLCLKQFLKESRDRQ